MPDQKAYEATLAGQLATRHPDLLSAENDLALLRGRLAIVTTWIHNPTYDDTARRALGDQLTRTRADTTETQPIPRDEIAAGLAARTADTETPKEHPQP